MRMASAVVLDAVFGNPIGPPSMDSATAFGKAARRRRIEPHRGVGPIHGTRQRVTLTAGVFQRTPACPVRCDQLHGRRMLQPDRPRVPQLFFERHRVDAFPPAGQTLSTGPRALTRAFRGTYFMSTRSLSARRSHTRCQEPFSCDVYFI